MAPPKLTASAVPSTALIHSTVYLLGAVSPRGTGVVDLQRFESGSWTQVSHKTASRTGSYAFAIRTPGVAGTAIYRVTRAGSSSAKALTSKTVHITSVTSAFKVTAASRATVAAGSPVVVTGTVNHKATGFIELQLLEHGRWTNYATGKLHRSAYSFSHVLSAGVWSLRTVKSNTTTIAGGVSNTVKVTVAAPPAAPTAAITLTGTLVTPGVYSSAVTATAVTTAPAGTKSVTYTVDGAAAQAYSAPVVVGGPGTHTVNVTITDTTGRTATASATWTEQSLQHQPVLPTVKIALSGTLSSGTAYIGNVTATVTAADAGGPGVASVKFGLDSGILSPYTGPIVSAGLGAHTLNVTVTDAAGNIGTATLTWSQISMPDGTPPTGSIALAGTPVSAGVYSGAVSVTITGTDNPGGSGVASIRYSLDNGPAQTYTGSPFSVFGVGSHTVVATITDLANNVSQPITKSWTEQAVAGGSSDIVVSSADQQTLQLPTARLVFSTADSVAVPSKQFTFTNTTGATISVTGITITGAEPGSYSLLSASSFSLAPGASTLVDVGFHPSEPTNCPTPSTDPNNPPIGVNVDQSATLTYTTNDTGQPSGAADLSGVNACYQGGDGEPVLDQLIPALGYSDQVDDKSFNHRFLGPARAPSGSDEIYSPYWVQANNAVPVSLVPLAHYATGNDAPGGYLSTGWYSKATDRVNIANTALSICPNTTTCKQVWNFPPDPTATTFNQNQKLLPTVQGVTTFTPTGAFGLFSGDFTDVNFSDDGLNQGHTETNTALTLPPYLHDMRVFPAYGPNHVLIPNAYLIGLDISRVPGFKNNDFQDVIFLLSNVQPDTAPSLTSLPYSVDLASDSVSGCTVGGFDGVLPDSGGVNPCVSGDIGSNSSGLTITSTAGQLANDNQQDAPYKSFDATHGAFTITTRVVGGIDQLNSDYQQIGEFFGTDDQNFIKLEIEHNGADSPHMTMFYREPSFNGGGGTSVTTITPPGLATATTVDLVIKGNTNTPDPDNSQFAGGSPQDQLSVYYSIDGAPLVQVGTVSEYPADLYAFFSRSAKAGILDSNSGASASLTATFSSFSITNN